jgi:hypothetical protein
VGGRLAYPTIVGWAGSRRESYGTTLDAAQIRVTPIARQVGVGLRLGPLAMVASRVAPHRLELLRADGTRDEIRVPDISRQLRRVCAGLLGLLVAVTLLRRLL